MAHQPSKYLNSGIQKLAQAKLARHPLTVQGQPFDSYLLKISPLYRLSRKIYLENQGTFEAALCSSKRVLSSPILLSNHIEYTPHEKEMVFVATDSIERKNHPNAILQLRSQSVCLFHEQNHRTLWAWLDKSAPGREHLRRYLNYIESLVIALDTALGDEIGPGQSRFFHGLGVLYDPGTAIKSKIKSKREYRNYLQLISHSTYLALEHYSPRDIHAIMSSLFSHKQAWVDHGVERSLRLDSGFINQTNVTWQQRNRRMIEKSLVDQRHGIKLSKDPLDHRQQYVIGEKVFEKLGL